MVIIADRLFSKRPAGKLILFFKTLGTNIATKPRFDAFKTLGTDLLAENALLEGYEEKVQAKDLRELGNRDNSRKKAVKIALKICDEVNAIADNDPGVYDDAGLGFVQTADPNRPIGITEVKSVALNPATGRIEVRAKKADKAKGYRIDLRTPAGGILEEYATIADTKGSFPAPAERGTYRCRAVPFDSKGNFGEPSAWSEDFGVY